MPVVVVIRDILLLIAALSGLGLPWLWGLRHWPAVERLALAVGGALLTGWLIGFALYAATLPLRWFWIAPAAGLAVTLARRDAVTELWRDAGARGALGRWALFAAAGLGWHMTVTVYSGGAWQADWYEHFDRAHLLPRSLARRIPLRGYLSAPGAPPAGKSVVGAAHECVRRRVFPPPSFP